MNTNTKHISIQISGDADAVNAAIALLHSLNFINGGVWSQAIRKRGERSIVRIAARAIDLLMPTIDRAN
jgi:uncharacterized membrane protein YoaK (UPF0700 family)